MMPTTAMIWTKVLTLPKKDGPEVAQGVGREEQGGDEQDAEVAAEDQDR